MFEAVIFILVGVSQAPNTTASVSHFGPRYKTLDACQAALLEMYAEKDYGEITRYTSGNNIAWFIDNAGNLNDVTYTCLEVGK